MDGGRLYIGPNHKHQLLDALADILKKGDDQLALMQ